MAVPATIIWEVRTGGSDTNGGGYKEGGSGTDWSVQDAAHTTFDGATITATTAGVGATITISGYTVASTDVDNILNITGGTNFTAGFYHIVSVNTGSSTWTLDRNCTSGAGSAMTGAMGGGFATPGQAAAVKTTHSTTGPVFIKSGNYSIANGSANTAGNKINISVGGAWIGYSTNRTRYNTDTQPVLQASANSTEIFNAGTFQVEARNIGFGKTASQTGVVGYKTNSSYNTAVRCIATGIATGFSSGNLALFIQCGANGCTTGFSTSGSGTRFDSCYAIAGTTGFTGGGIQIYYEHCIAAANAGTAFVTDSGAVCRNCVAYGQTGASGHGFNAIGTRAENFINCVAVNNAQTGFRCGANVLSDDSRLQNCATYGNGTATDWASNFQTGAITLSGDPFTNGAGNDFSLNNTAGAGASLRSAAFPSSFPGLSTSNYDDVGAVQHADPAAGGGGSVLHSAIIGGVA